MNLKQMRKLFAQHSGMRKYVTMPDYGDNGANLLLQQGQKLLDFMQPAPGSNRSHLYDTAEGVYQVPLEGCRAVGSVYLLNSDGLSELTEKTTEEIRSLYTSSADEIDSGTPKYWAPTSFLEPGEQDSTSDSFASVYYDICFGKDYETPALLVLPPADGVYTLEVHGRWFTKKLVNDTDESWWSINYPLALVQAAMVVIEMLNRNNEGVAAGVRALQDVYLVGLERDQALQETVHVGGRIVG